MYGGTEYGPPQGRSRDRQPARTGDLAGSGLDPDHGVSKCVYPAALQAQEDQRPTTGILVIHTWHLQYVVLVWHSTVVGSRWHPGRQISPAYSASWGSSCGPLTMFSRLPDWASSGVCCDRFAINDPPPLTFPSGESPNLLLSWSEQLAPRPGGTLRNSTQYLA